jgi:hypothetical protein
MIFQSVPCLANAVVLPPAVRSIESTLSRSNFSSVFSRRSNVDLLNVDSWNDGIRKTRFSSFRFANRSPPVGDFSPMSSLR